MCGILYNRTSRNKLLRPPWEIQRITGGTLLGQADERFVDILDVKVRVVLILRVRLGLGLGYAEIGRLA